MTMLAVQSFLLILAAFLGGAMLACFLRRVFFVRDNERPSPQGGSRTKTQSEVRETQTVEVKTTQTQTQNTATSEDSSRFGRALTGPGVMAAGAATAAAVTSAASESPLADADGSANPTPVPSQPATSELTDELEPAPVEAETVGTPEEIDEAGSDAIVDEAAEKPSLQADTPKREAPAYTQEQDPAAIAAAAAAAQDMIQRTFPGQNGNAAAQAKDPAPVAVSQAHDDVSADAQLHGEDDADTEIAPQPERTATDAVTAEAEADTAILAEEVAASAELSDTQIKEEPGQLSPEPDQVPPIQVSPSGSDVRALHSVRSEALVGSGERSTASGASNVFTIPAAAGVGIDDLKQIRGIGVLIEKKLNAMGIRSYEQIANWTAEDVRKVSDSLDFKGRIERESWIEQARILSSGGTTDFSRRA